MKLKPYYTTTRMWKISVVRIVSCTIGRNRKLTRPLWKTSVVPAQDEHDYSRFTLNMGTSECLTFALLGTQPTEIHTYHQQKNVQECLWLCYFQYSQNWILPKCPSPAKWRNVLWCIHPTRMNGSCLLVRLWDDFYFLLLLISMS